MSIAFKDYWIKRYMYLTKYRIPITAIAAVPFYMPWIYWHFLTIKMQSSLHVIGTINFKNKNASFRNMYVFLLILHAHIWTLKYLCIPLWLWFIGTNKYSLFEGTLVHPQAIINHTFAFSWNNSVTALQTWPRSFQGS